MTLETAQPVADALPRATAGSGGRVRRAALTWLSGAFYTGTTLIVGLLVTPKIVRFLGDERFGAYRAITDWTGYLLLADLGLGSAFGVLLLRARTSGAGAQANVVRYAIRLLAKLTLPALLLGAVLTLLIPHLIRGSGSVAPAELRAATAVAVACLLLGPLLVFRALLDASQRGYLVHAALLAQALLIIGLQLLLAWRGWGLMGQTLATFAGLALFTLLITRWGTKLLRDARGAPEQSSAPVAGRQLWSLAWPLGLAGLGNRVNLMTDTIVIGRMLGAAPVAMLFLTQRVILLCAAQVNAIANSSWAGLAELRETGERALFESRLAEIVRLIVGVGTVLVGSVAAFDRHFVILWVGPRFYGGELLCAATAAAAVVFGFLLPFAWAIDMAGDTRHRLPVSTLGAALNLVLSVILVKEIGLAGVALGTLLSYLLTDAWYCPYLVCRRYHVRPRAIALAAARGLALGIPWAAGAWILASVHTPPWRWIGLICEGVLLGGLSLAYCWLAILDSSERAEWRARIKRFGAASPAPSPAPLPPISAG
jgi:O-antigen/teichoic acid export membrane protein